MPEPTDTPQPWAPDGEGWNTYRMHQVRGRVGWEVEWAGVIVPATNVLHLPSGGEVLVYARPIPEPPIKVGDRVRYIDDDEAVVLGVDGDDVWVRWTTGVVVGAAFADNAGRFRRLPADASEPRS